MADVTAEAPGVTVGTRPALSGEVYYPSPEVIAQANIQDYEAQVRRAQEDLEGFWAERAEELEWYRKWDKVLERARSPSTNGLWAPRRTSCIMPWTAM